jgi:hypothetical protein
MCVSKKMIRLDCFSLSWSFSLPSSSCFSLSRSFSPPSSIESILSGLHTTRKNISQFLRMFLNGGRLVKKSFLFSLKWQKHIWLFLLPLGIRVESILFEFDSKFFQKPFHVCQHSGAGCYYFCANVWILLLKKKKTRTLCFQI